MFSSAHAPRRAGLALTLTWIALAGSGCAEPTKGPVVFYLDGAGWYGSGGSVESGLRKAGYKGAFETFSWSAFLGPAHDHFVTAHSKATAKRLAERIERFRKADPDGVINVMGLSAGTAVILNALEMLDDASPVDNVVLFSPTISAERDLTRAMRHVRRNLYATSSPHDGIAGSLAVNADGRPGPAAGEHGFRMPHKSSDAVRDAYAHVINIPWQPSYIGYDFTGGHTSSTRSDFVAAVIAPRILTSEPYPLDRPLSERVILGSSQ